MKYFVYALIIGLSFGCNKKVTISGRLMHDCLTPAGNQTVAIHQKTQGFIDETTTNMNGLFKFTIKTRRKNQFSLRAPDLILDGIVFDRNIDLGNVYQEPFYFNCYLTLNTDSAYTENDTIFYNCFNTSWCALPGPFTSGVVDSFYNWQSRKPPFIFSFDPVTRITIRNNFDPSKEKVIIAPVPFCTNEWIELVYNL